MLFISILLSVWFVVWLAFSMHTKDVLQLLVVWMKDMYESEEDTDALLEKSEEGIYHLSCSKCNHAWWSIEPNTNFCPNCGEKKDA